MRGDVSFSEDRLVSLVLSNLRKAKQNDLSLRCDPTLQSHGMGEMKHVVFSLHSCLLCLYPSKQMNMYFMQLEM